MAAESSSSRHSSTSLSSSRPSVPSVGSSTSSIPTTPSPARSFSSSLSEDRRHWVSFHKLKGEVLQLKSERERCLKCIAPSPRNRCRVYAVNDETESQRVEELVNHPAINTSENIERASLRRLAELVLCPKCKGTLSNVEYYADYWHASRVAPPYTPNRPQPTKNASAPAKMTTTVDNTILASKSETTREDNLSTLSASDLGEEGSLGNIGQQSPTLRKSKDTSSNRLETPPTKRRRKSSSSEAIPKDSRSSIAFARQTDSAEVTASFSDTEEPHHGAVEESDSNEETSSERANLPHAQRPSKDNSANSTTIKMRQRSSFTDRGDPSIAQAPVNSPTLSPWQVHDLVGHEIKSKLKPHQKRENDKGIIYVLKRRDDPQLVKIGITTRTLWNRRKEIGETCRVTVDAVYDDEQRYVMHIQRLERLVHASLKSRRAEIDCYCAERGIEHHEWFRITEDEAVFAVQLWRKFIRMRPYKSNGLLSDFWIDRLEAIPQPARELEHLNVKHWEAFISSTHLDVWLYRFRSVFSSPSAQERLVKHWYLLLIASFAVAFQYLIYGLLSSLFWTSILSVIFVDMLE